MKVFSLFTIATTSLLVLVVPASAHVLPHHNAISTSSDGTVSNDNSTTGENDNNSTQVSTDLGKFNGTWYTISMEEDIYKEMQKVAKKYNTTCSCPQLTLTPAGPAALDANASCLLQTGGSSTQILSHGLLTLLPDRRATKANKIKDHRATTAGNQTSSISKEYYFALLFSRLYIDSDDADLDHRGNQSDHLPNLHHQGVQLPQVDSGVKGNLYWSFFSSKNGSSADDVALVRTKHMISGDNKHDVPDVNMVLSKSQDLFDDAAYNETAPSIPGLGKDYKWDYVKLDKCNATSDGTQPSETSGGGNNPEATSSATSDQQPQVTSSSTQQSGEDQGQQPIETTGGGDQQQPQPTETSGGGGDQQQPQATETNGGGDQQQPQPTETNNGDGNQQQPQPTETNTGGGGDQQQSTGGDGQ